MIFGYLSLVISRLGAKEPVRQAGRNTGIYLSGNRCVMMKFSVHIRLVLEKGVDRYAKGKQSANCRTSRSDV
jgi:hypothetical protein